MELDRLGSMVSACWPGRLAGQTRIKKGERKDPVGLIGTQAIAETECAS